MMQIKRQKAQQRYKIMIRRIKIIIMMIMIMLMKIQRIRINPDALSKAKCS